MDVTITILFFKYISKWVSTLVCNAFQNDDFCIKWVSVCQSHLDVYIYYIYILIINYKPAKDKRYIWKNEEIYMHYRCISSPIWLKEHGKFNKDNTDLQGKRHIWVYFVPRWHERRRTNTKRPRSSKYLMLHCFTLIFGVVLIVADGILCVSNITLPV